MKTPKKVNPVVQLLADFVEHTDMFFATIIGAFILVLGLFLLWLFLIILIKAPLAVIIPSAVIYGIYWALKSAHRATYSEDDDE